MDFDLAAAARARLEARLEHRFEDPALLERAVTHRSRGAANNERLEFLGDSILNFLVAERLFADHPRATEGSLTRRRAALVRKETLADVARDLDLGDALQLGSGELKSGGRDRDSILADALEAVVGAVYLDAGIETCRGLVARLLEARIEERARESAGKDPKTRLQEALQSRGLPLPVYEVTGVEGEPHAQRFTVCCAVRGLGFDTRGHGTSRRRAEQDAAGKAIERLAAEIGT